MASPDPGEASILATIERLVAEEHRLFDKKSLSPLESQRLAGIELELDRHWDLLRKCRAVKNVARRGQGARRSAAPEW